MNASPHKLRRERERAPVVSVSKRAFTSLQQESNNGNNAASEERKKETRERNWRKDARKAAAAAALVSCPETRASHLGSLPPSSLAPASPPSSLSSPLVMGRAFLFPFERLARVTLTNVAEPVGIISFDHYHRSCASLCLATASEAGARERDDTRCLPLCFNNQLPFELRFLLLFFLLPKRLESESLFHSSCLTLHRYSLRCCGL